MAQVLSIPPGTRTEDDPRIERGDQEREGLAAPPRILIVDGELNDARILLASLTRAGFFVEDAPSLAQARVRLKAGRYDLVLAAELLPDGLGIDLLHEKGRRPAPVVLLSDDVREERIRRAFSAGILDVFVKDASLLPLIDVRLRALLERQAERRRFEELREENDNLVRCNRLLLEISVKDPLTGILNRRGLEEAIQREMSRADRTRQELALAYFDLDNFKAINDQFGHEAGDFVLKSFGDLMTREGRSADFFARVGGDEFAALLPSTTLNGAANYAERVRMKIEHTPVPFGGEPLLTTVSAGAALFSESVQTGRELLNLADDRLYRAKSAGRNRIVFN